jgi:hypothetical protein
MANGVKFGRPRKLNPHQCWETLERIEAGETYTAIARSYAVDPNTISRLASREAYRASPSYSRKIA